MKRTALKQMVDSGKIKQDLFKYRSISSENTDKIFTDHTLWFEHPNKFNDPFDCWANIQSVDLSGISCIINRSGLSKQDKRICELGKQSLTPQALKQAVDKVMSNLGVCCLGMDEKNILMWSHYSEDHKGICLQFDVLEDSDFFTLAIPVRYVDQMPIYNHPDDEKFIFEKIIQPKSKCWEYEKEVRIVKTPSDINRNKNQAFRFKPQSLKKVIFGCKATEETIKKYRNLCLSNNLGHVEFSQMEQSKEGRFELIEIPLS